MDHLEKTKFTRCFVLFLEYMLGFASLAAGEGLNVSHSHQIYENTGLESVKAGQIIRHGLFTVVKLTTHTPTGLYSHLYKSHNHIQNRYVWHTNWSFGDKKVTKNHISEKIKSPQEDLN